MKKQQNTTPRPSKVMGRALSERRWDKATEAVLPPKAGRREMVLGTTGRGEIVIPINRVGAAMPDDTDTLIDILKGMKVI